jgi:hypothetical protein
MRMATHGSMNARELTSYHNRFLAGKGKGGGKFIYFYSRVAVPYTSNKILRFLTTKCVYGRV